MEKDDNRSNMHLKKLEACGEWWHLHCGSCEFPKLLFIEKKCAHAAQSHLSLELSRWHSCYTDGPGSTRQHGPATAAWHRWLGPPRHPSGSPSVGRLLHRSSSERRSSAGPCSDGQAHTWPPRTRSAARWELVCQQTALYLIRLKKDGVQAESVKAKSFTSH